LDVINLNDIFDVGQAQLDFLRENPPPSGIEDISFQEAIDYLEQGRTDLSGLADLVAGRTDASAEAIANLFDDPALRSRFTGADLLEGVDLPETDLSAIQAYRLSGADAASRARETLAQAQLSAQAGSFGGLENMRRTAEGLSFGEAQARGEQATNIVGQTRAEEFAAEQFIANLQALAAQNAATINRDLLLAQAMDLSSSGQRVADAELRAGLSGANMSGLLAQTSANEILANLGIATGNMTQDRADWLREFNAIGGAQADAINQLSVLLGQTGQQTQFAGQLGAQDLGAQLGLYQLLAPQLEQQQIDPFAWIQGMRNTISPPSLEGPSGGQFGFSFNPQALLAGLNAGGANLPMPMPV
jgi:hypothetical protein